MSAGSGFDASDIVLADGYELAAGGVFIDQGGGSFSYTGRVDIIAEPSTATLSLLALTGLLARRRRGAR